MTTGAEWTAHLRGRCPVCLDDPDAPDHRCHCGLNEDDQMCIEGRVYGPCGDVNCGGVCVYEDDCPCSCHRPPAPTPCCDMHNRHCEPPADLCCRDCAEVNHPDHPAGVTCVLHLDRPAGWRPPSEWTERDTVNACTYALCDRCGMPRHCVTSVVDGVVWEELLCSNTQCPASRSDAP